MQSEGTVLYGVLTEHWRSFLADRSCRGRGLGLTALRHRRGRSIPQVRNPGPRFPSGRLRRLSGEPPRAAFV
jgi:hypothetical protein